MIDTRLSPKWGGYCASCIVVYGLLSLAPIAVLVYQYGPSFQFSAVLILVLLVWVLGAVIEFFFPLVSVPFVEFLGHRLDPVLLEKKPFLGHLFEIEELHHPPTEEAA